MRFQACDKEGNLLAVIEALTWFDAKHYGLGRFGEEVQVAASPVDFEATVEIKWEGTDAGTGANRRHQVLRVRPTPQDPWSEWARP